MDIYTFTKREKEVLNLFCYKSCEIANILCISKSTAKTHINNILHKLKETSKIRALVKALRMGLINLYSVETSYKDVGFWDKTGKYMVKMEKENENVA